MPLVSVSRTSTGYWLLQCEQYNRWQDGKTKHLWIYGKAGCGKTVLCYSIIENLQEHCENNLSIGLAFSYFTFSDNRKQNYDDPLRALIARFGLRENALSDLCKVYTRRDRGAPSKADLKRILCLSLTGNDQTLLVLDALDECPTAADTRRLILDRSRRLAALMPNLKIVATSRDIHEIHCCMKTLTAKQSTIAHSAGTELKAEGRVSRDALINDAAPDSDLLPDYN